MRAPAACGFTHSAETVSAIHELGGGRQMKIYFDMDGVLADFDRGVRELHSCQIQSGV